MKNPIILLILILSGGFVTSCSKDGVNGPVQTIKAPGPASAPGTVAQAHSKLNKPRLDSSGQPTADDGTVDFDDDSDSPTTTTTPPQAPTVASSTATTAASSGGSSNTTLATQPPAPATTTSPSSSTPSTKITYYDADTTAAKVNEAEALLNQYPSGKTYLAELQGNNITGSAINIKLGPAAQVTKIADISGGSFRAKAGAVAVIIANGDSSAADLAHVLAYETEKISDHVTEQNYFKGQTQFLTQVQGALKKYKAQGPQTLTADEQSAVIFYTSGLFCMEIKAFSRNLTLIKEGLPYSLDALKTLDLGTLVTQYYLTPRQLPNLNTVGDLGTLTKLCQGQKTVTDFQTSVVPQAPKTPSK